MNFLSGASLVHSVCLVCLSSLSGLSGFWLNETNQINQMNQTNETNQITVFLCCGLGTSRASVVESALSAR
jgi:hypothetical protein